MTQLNFKSSGTNPKVKRENKTFTPTELPQISPHTSSHQLRCHWILWKKWCLVIFGWKMPPLELLERCRWHSYFDVCNVRANNVFIIFCFFVKRLIFPSLKLSKTKTPWKKIYEKAPDSRFNFSFYASKDNLVFKLFWKINKKSKSPLSLIFFFFNDKLVILLCNKNM
jgi:hypothetical protein